MPVWSTAIGVGDNIQSKALWNMLLSALLERYKGAYGDADGLGNMISAIPNIFGAGTGLLVGGEVIQSTQNFIGAFLNAITQVMHNYVDHTITYGGNTDRFLFDSNGTGGGEDAFWKFPDVRTRLGLTTTKCWAKGGTSGFTTLTHVPANDNTMWLRYRPREILSTNATFDLQGNPAAAGQRAYFFDTGSSLCGTRWRCVSSGNWVRDESQPCDRLSNAFDPPNTINFEQDLIWGTGGAIPVDLGDYIGWWQLEEARQVINLMRWAARPVDAEANTATHTESRTVTDRSGDPAVFAGNTYASIVSDITTRWPGAPVIHSWLGEGLNGFPQCTSDVESDTGSPPTWTGGAYRSDATWTLGSSGILGNDPLGSMSKNYQWLTYGGDTGGTFDANGDSVSNGAWNVFNSGGPSTAAMLTAPTFGNVSTVPNFSPSPGGTRGYAVLSAWVLLKFDVAGGFAYLY